jgi:hypothetical protein
MVFAGMADNRRLVRRIFMSVSPSARGGSTLQNVSDAAFLLETRILKNIYMRLLVRNGISNQGPTWN